MTRRRSPSVFLMVHDTGDFMVLACFRIEVVSGLYRRKGRNTNPGHTSLEFWGINPSLLRRSSCRRGTSNFVTELSIPSVLICCQSFLHLLQLRRQLLS